MLNLLLREDRHWIRREYFLRLGIVFAIGLIVLSVIWGIVLISPYSQIFVEKQIIEEQVEDIRNSDVTKERNELSSLSQEIESKIEYLSRSSIEPTFLIASVLESQPAGIGLSEIGINITELEDGGVIAYVDMRGGADSRNNLVAFQKALLSKEVFSKVDIPYSNFAKDVDVPFTISATTIELEEYLEKQKNTAKSEVSIPVEDNIEENEEE